ncbi:MAG: diguanylate cyclase [Actinobacteria bacterium]|nr:diguanylate cyclase [Actinomycetota bacterium]
MGDKERLKPEDLKKTSNSRFSVHRLLSELVSQNFDDYYSNESKKCFELFQLLIENSLDIITIINKDGVIGYISPSVKKILGYKQSDLTGKSIFDFTNPRDILDVRKIHDLALQNPGTGYSIKCQLLRKDKSWCNVEGKGKAVLGRSNKKFVLINVRDINERELFENALQNSQKMFSQLLEGLPLAVFAVDKNGTPIYQNKTSKEILQSDINQYSTTGELVNFDNAHLAETDQLYPKDRSPLRKALEGLSITVDDMEIRHSDRVIPLEVSSSPIFNVDGEVEYALTTFRDISERKRLETQLKMLSMRDPLTGLYNRAYYNDELARLDGSREYPISIISTDLDGLKLINDTMGHSKGDELIKSYASLLVSAFRKSDVTARIGGDEFAIILPHTDANACHMLCRRLEAGIETYNESNKYLPLSISVGISTSLDKETSLIETYKRADTNMYYVKSKQTERSAQIILTAIRALMAEKDYSDDGHISRLVQMSRALGERIGLTRKEVSQLVLLAEIHDLGKVVIPDNVLFKKGPLNKKERKRIEEHPTVGYRIARYNPELSHVADLILYHHRWWNGQGYPLNLKGEDIPISCRILSIVDAYDAMTSDRPYRKAMSHEDAVAELRRCAGTQFDPNLVEKFITML